MKKIIKKIESPLFKNHDRKIIIWEPKKISELTPVIFIYNSKILKTDEKEFFSKDGIDIFKSVNDVLKNAIIISIPSFDKLKCKNQYNKLTNFKNSSCPFMKLARSKIIELKKEYKGLWFGIGFSLSAQLMEKEKLFDFNILISPYIKGDIYKLSKNSIVFFGSKEYKLFSNNKINKPLSKLKKINPEINFLEIKNLKHKLKSWNKYFSLILKSSVKPYLEFKKIGLNGVGKFQYGNSNISFHNKNKLIKIKANNIDNIGLEKSFIEETKYKKDYLFIDDETFIKEYVKGAHKNKLTIREIKNLAKEIKELHILKINKKIPKYSNVGVQDVLVMTHGDLNPKNILFYKNRPTLIDFEWARLNTKWWDIVSIFRSFKFCIYEQKVFLNSYGIQYDNVAIQKMNFEIQKTEKIFFKKNKEYFSIVKPINKWT